MRPRIYSVGQSRRKCAEKEGFIGAHEKDGGLVLDALTELKGRQVLMTASVGPVVLPVIVARGVYWAAIFSCEESENNIEMP